MLIMMIGMVLFFGVHSIGLVAPDWRLAKKAVWGEMPWKAVYSLVSLLGFGVIVYGFGLARQNPVVLWSRPTGATALCALLMLPAMIFLVSSQFKSSYFAVWARHPMTLSVVFWSVAHLLIANTLAELVLFGAFFCWSFLLFGVNRRRDRAAQARFGPAETRSTIIVLILGIGLWLVFAKWLHPLLIGVVVMLR